MDIFMENIVTICFNLDVFMEGIGSLLFYALSELRGLI
jgi:hypothetical protein